MRNPTPSNRLIGVIYDDQRHYDKAEPFLQNSYQVAKILREKDEVRWHCSRTQYGIAVAHHLWDDLALTFEHNDCDVKKKLANAKLMVNWKLNRVSGFCRYTKRQYRGKRRRGKGRRG